MTFLPRNTYVKHRPTYFTCFVEFIFLITISWFIWITHYNSFVQRYKCDISQILYTNLVILIPILFCSTI